MLAHQQQRALPSVDMQPKVSKPKLAQEKLLCQPCVLRRSRLEPGNWPEVLQERETLRGWHALQRSEREDAELPYCDTTAELHARWLEVRSGYACFWRGALFYAICPALFEAAQPNFIFARRLLLRSALLFLRECRGPPKLACAHTDFSLTAVEKRSEGRVPGVPELHDNYTQDNDDDCE